MIAPNDKAIVWVSRLLSIRGWKRIIRKTPATTIVLECSSAETGVGPSIADGSHGCRPNWADFPVAAKSRLVRGKEFGVMSRINIC